MIRHLLIRAQPLTFNLNRTAAPQYDMLQWTKASQSSYRHHSARDESKPYVFNNETPCIQMFPLHGNNGGLDRQLSSLHNAVQQIYPTAGHKWFSVGLYPSHVPERLLVRCFHRVSSKTQMHALWFVNDASEWDTSSPLFNEYWHTINNPVYGDRDELNKMFFLTTTDN